MVNTAENLSTGNSSKKSAVSTQERAIMARVRYICSSGAYLIQAVRGQQFKLIHTVSKSEYYEYHWSQGCSQLQKSGGAIDNRLPICPSVLFSIS